MGWVLLRFARAQAFRAFVDAGAIPIRLIDKLLQKLHEMFAGESSLRPVIRLVHVVLFLAGKPLDGLIADDLV